MEMKLECLDTGTFLINLSYIFKIPGEDPDIKTEVVSTVSEGVYHDSEDVELTDEEKDGKILVDVIASIAEWKDRQQRKLLHYLFHR